MTEQMATLLDLYGQAAARFHGLTSYYDHPDHPSRQGAEAILEFRKENLLNYIEQHYVPREPS